MARVTILAAVAHAAGVAGAQGAKTGAAQLTVRIGPEASMRFAGNAAVGVKVRMHPGARVVVWRASGCGASVQGGHEIVQSGSYTIPLAGIPGEGSRICLRASDGSLAKELAAP